jgi:hypothetical protein
LTAPVATLAERIGESSRVAMGKLPTRERMFERLARRDHFATVPNERNVLINTAELDTPESALAIMAHYGYEPREREGV